MTHRNEPSANIAIMGGKGIGFTQHAYERRKRGSYHPSKVVREPLSRAPNAYRKQLCKKGSESANHCYCSTVGSPLRSSNAFVATVVPLLTVSTIWLVIEASTRRFSSRRIPSTAASS